MVQVDDDYGSGGGHFEVGQLKPNKAGAAEYHSFHPGLGLRGIKELLTNDHSFGK